MDLTREEDYNAYQQLGCRFIEAKIRVHIPIHCKNDTYKRDDTLMGRLIYMCTCRGKALSERKKEIQNMFMRELVPIDSVWRINEVTFRQQQYFCIQPDRNVVECKSPMGCYETRYAMPINTHTVSNDLPAGCISDIDQKLLDKYPYLALCSQYLKMDLQRMLRYGYT
ncbi:hypothetical protein DINM_004074 [Dirofilaria immitis]|nr:hypothetical protein [Dirofilaria immitis]